MIWRNYRQSYRYRNWQQIYLKIIVIEKNGLTYTPIHHSKSGRPRAGMCDVIIWCNTSATLVMKMILPLRVFAYENRCDISIYINQTKLVQPNYLMSFHTSGRELHSLTREALLTASSDFLSIGHCVFHFLKGITPLSQHWHPFPPLGGCLKGAMNERVCPMQGSPWRRGRWWSRGPLRMTSISMYTSQIIDIG